MRTITCHNFRTNQTDDCYIICVRIPPVFVALSVAHSRLCHICICRPLERFIVFPSTYQFSSSVNCHAIISIHLQKMSKSTTSQTTANNSTASKKKKSSLTGLVVRGQCTANNPLDFVIYIVAAIISAKVLFDSTHLFSCFVRKMREKNRYVLLRDAYFYIFTYYLWKYFDRLHGKIANAIWYTEQSMTQFNDLSN